MSLFTRSRQLPDRDKANAEEGPAPDGLPAHSLDEAATGDTAASGTSADAAASGGTAADSPAGAAAPLDEAAPKGGGSVGDAAPGAAAERGVGGDTSAGEAAGDAAVGEAVVANDAATGDAASHHDPAADQSPAEAAAGGGWRDKYPVAARALAWGVTAVSVALVLFALLLPNRLVLITPSAFVHIPVEAVLGAGVLLLLPPIPRRVAAVLAGVFLGLLTILNLLDIGFNEFLGRGFNVVLDWILLDDAQSYLKDSLGSTTATLAVIAAGVLVLVLLAVMTLACLRLGNVMARNNTVATRTVLVLGTAWVVCAALGLQVSGAPIASRNTVVLVQNRVKWVKATLKDEREFEKVAAVDSFGDTPGDQLLTGLRGKDVIFTFIESYGRSAIEDPLIAPGVDAVLDEKTKELSDAGYSAKSGWLTSATYGGSSWLGHSTFLSGLWINNQSRYRTVTASDHLTITRAFKRTGAWRTVGIMPGVTKGWPEAKFYGLDNVYDSRNLGYQGPKFSWSTMPDQYALSAFERLEHGKRHDKPLMSEIILTSSHQPWAPIPKMIGWDEVGDGSVYDDIEKAGKDPKDVFTDSTQARTEYGKSIQYSLNSLIDYVVKYGNKNTVLVFLGDHQPMAKVSGDHASRDVPVAVVAHDPAVLKRISDWGWQDGLRPGADTPVWRMDTFRDRFLTAYGPQPGSGPSGSGAPDPKSADPKSAGSKSSR
ncbi:sulfatase-like hydrolase/transferase [Streptomyces sp. ME19-01-6]|uniref:sulfatase-like hydrolase/transferase n=1 Tax=Streptomyces sp. ME19-01-6 TaxID=3028686 RepID=UPI0029A92419|nr:sulfatase-like hydrolase/transferase [Streptomyces sp. ME19-01-6]MDX3228874.1 sulfatase [Streptomyces sp. ME19-01-6]